jgi:predicted NBD/HSP70 family sugar kinase
LAMALVIPSGFGNKMQALYEQLNTLSGHPKAIAWKIRYHTGLSSSSPSRQFVLFAPPEAVYLVLMRLHNGILLTNPVAVELDAPIARERLEPWLGILKNIHRVGIHLAGEPIIPVSFYDLPGEDMPEVLATTGIAAGLDIGGTTIKGCILDSHGRILATASTPTWPEGAFGVGSLVDRCRKLLQKILDESGVVAPDSLGIGLAAPMGVGGQVLELSTILRERVGDPAVFQGFAGAVASGLVEGPVAIFNDLSNLGRHLSSTGARRMARVQIGTSFGGCWVDADGLVFATEMGRLVVDISEAAIPHTYLPLKGAMRTYLSNQGVARMLEEAGEKIDPRTCGHHLKALIELGHPAGLKTIAQLGKVLKGVVGELHATLPGLVRVECGGSMLAGASGKLLKEAVGETLVEFAVAAQPAFDGAVAAALAPRVGVRLKGMKRVSV